MITCIRFRCRRKTSKATIAVLTIAIATCCAGAIGQESLPVQSQENETVAETANNGVPCTPISDLPLGSLTVDARPRKADGNLVNLAQLPAGCWESSPLAANIGVIFMDGNCGWHIDLSREVLELARFCHRPLFFEDVSLERYGVSNCYPPLHAATHFTIDLALWPARALFTKPGKCVRTAPPTICTPH